MKGKGIKIERETVITFNEDEDNAQIWTASEVVHNRLKKRLGTDYMIEDGERHSTWKMPKKLIRLPKRPREVSEATRQAARERFAAKPPSFEGGKLAK